MPSFQHCTTFYLFLCDLILSKFNVIFVSGGDPNGTSSAGSGQETRAEPH